MISLQFAKYKILPFADDYFDFKEHNMVLWTHIYFYPILATLITSRISKISSIENKEKISILPLNNITTLIIQ